MTQGINERLFTIESDIEDIKNSMPENHCQDINDLDMLMVERQKNEKIIFGKIHQLEEEFKKLKLEINQIKQQIKIEK